MSVHIVKKRTTLDIEKFTKFIELHMKALLKPDEIIVDYNYLKDMFACSCKKGGAHVGWHFYGNTLKEVRECINREWLRDNTVCSVLPNSHVDKGAITKLQQSINKLHHKIRVKECKIQDLHETGRCLALDDFVGI